MNVPVDVTDIVLHTERLVLRAWKQADLDDLYEYASVDGVGQMAGWLPHQNKEESQKILNMFIGQKKTFALEYRGKVIGSLGIEKYDEKRFPELADQKCREIGYVLAKEYWGRGLMTEAVKEAIRYLFEDEGLDIILCGHFVSNVRSSRVQEKCGFHYYQSGTFHTQFDTAEEDEMNILRKEEYFASGQ